MMLKSQAPTKPNGVLRWLRLAAVGVAAAAGATGVTVGCLDRPVNPQDPKTSNVYVAEIRQTAVDKIDLLFMIDNSASMADKQEILGDAVPVLLSRLITPVCIDEKTGQTFGNSDAATGRCAQGAPEFTPIKDIHIGVITSSLGAHGGTVSGCQDTVEGQASRGNDHAQLLGIVQPTLYSTNSSGFLAWDPTRKANGETDARKLISDFTNMVKAAGETGCGYEAQLESWYRFLIDPAPPFTVDPPRAGAAVVFPNIPPEGSNPILAQRKAFLRPDSLVAIIMLTDENDCSVVDEGQGFYATSPNKKDNLPLPRGTSQCKANPNDPCCTLCGAPAPGCPDQGQDAECAKGSYTPGEVDDQANLRCFNQKQRFGIDFLYPVSRYVDGLRLTQVPVRSVDPATGAVTWSAAANPLLVNGSTLRDPGLVFLAGIVGVPWQDVATADSWPDGAPLKYLKFQELGDRWDVILGKPEGAMPGQPPVLPTDRLMVETYEDRAAKFPSDRHPLFPNDTAYAPKPPTSAAGANKINGHEATIADQTDLQYACIFDRKTPKTCEANSQACDCRPGVNGVAGDEKYMRPLCEGNIQRRAKAYPGVRELQVLKGYGDYTQNSIVASICPKVVTTNNPESDGSYGYNPAVAAIVERLKEALRGKCLPRRLSVDNDTGEVPCSVVEAGPPSEGGACNCRGEDEGGRGKGRSDAKPEIKPATYRLLSELGYCGSGGLPPCSDAGYCLCEINQFRGDDLEQCLTAAQTSSDIYGYCYVDPAASRASNDPRVQGRAAAQDTIVSTCPASQKRLLRFAGTNVPARGALALIACVGATTRDVQVTTADGM